MPEDIKDTFYQKVTNKLHAAAQQPGITEFAKYISQSLEKEGWIYAFGTGHSHMMAEEIFYRAGGLARVRPILDPKLMLHQNAEASTDFEREEGKSQEYLGSYQFTDLDTLIIASNSGRNAAVIDMALSAKAKGCKVIGLTNLKHSKSVDSRHSSGNRLFEVADVILDNFGETGDASLKIQGDELRIAPTSTITGSFILHLVLSLAVEDLLQKGKTPEVFKSSNIDSSEEHNSMLIKKYKHQIKGL